MIAPVHPKIYHIVHIDHLISIIADQHLWCDAEVGKRLSSGTIIGMNNIKQRRLNLYLTSYPDLRVSDCVPFYFCPRSIMLYLIDQANHNDLQYRGGQRPIIHLEADLHSSIEWAQSNSCRWVFTLSNAGAKYFEDRHQLSQLDEINWDAVQANRWSGNGISSSIRDGKQAEFLMEHRFPWHLVERIGVHSQPIYQQVLNALITSDHKTKVEIMPTWYY